MATAALIVAILALLVAFLTMRRATGLQERLEQTTSQLYEVRSTMSRANETFENKLNDIRLQMRRQAGEAIFNPSMTIADAMSVHPRVTEVLANFHLGGCSHCTVSDVDTIEGACQTYGIDQAALMNALNGLVSGGSGGTAGPAAGAKMLDAVASDTKASDTKASDTKVSNVKVSF